MDLYFILFLMFTCNGLTVEAQGLCGKICTCETTESKDVLVTCMGKNVTKVPAELPANTSKLYLSGTNIRSVPARAFAMYPFLTELFFRDTYLESCKLEYLDAGAFDGLPRLMTLGMIGCVHLTSLGPGVLGVFQKLETLHVYRSGLTSVPNLSHFGTLNPDMNGIMREIDFRNNRIATIHTDEFFGVKTYYLKLEENKITSIESHAFRNAAITSLSLKKNTALQDINERAFDGVAILETLDLSHTSISSLPTRGLGGLRHLILKFAPSLKHFPSVLEFRKIERAELTYPHHCCTFKNPEKQNPTAWKAKQAQEMINKKCAISTTPLPTPLPTPPGIITSTDIKTSIDILPAGLSPLWDFKKPININYNNGARGMQNAFFQTQHDAHLRVGIDSARNDSIWGDRHRMQNLNGTNSKVNTESSEFDPFGVFRTLSGQNVIIDDRKTPPTAVFHTSTVAVDENLTQRAQCGEIYIYNRDIACTPEPDALNPCEDVMGYVWLRVTVWFVLLAALLGNSIVLIVLTSSRGKFTVAKFLMCNLAFADFMMGVYLILLASIDIHTLGEYFNHAVKWQNEGGCQAAGFLSVFSSELSVFTLTILTLERWYAISHAIHLNKRLRLRQSMALMLFGYTCAVILALLPLVGISSYGNVSICLPMKIETGLDIGYVVSLLIMNGVMFLAICFCYISMYLSVKGSVSTARSNDATIAKRMSLLVFTNFACWAPIAFFGLTASAGAPLIDITNSKILLVFFYPLNSCANPFLYAILTKQFRKDFFILLGKFGICVDRANMYRGTFASRTMSNSRGNKDSKTHRVRRQTESVFSYIGSNQSSKHSVNGLPKVHPSNQNSAEAQPFIEQRSHLDRATDFANKEPVLGADDVTLDPWDNKEANEGQEPSHPTYVRSVSDYVKFNSVKVPVGRSNPRARTSVDTFCSSSTDTTFISDNSHSSEDVWQVRIDCLKQITDKKEKQNERSATNMKEMTYTDYTTCEEFPSRNQSCTAMTSDFEERDVSQVNLQKNTDLKNGDSTKLKKTSFKNVNNTVSECTPKFCRSPSLGSLDETNEMCLLAHAQMNGISGSVEENITTEFMSKETLEMDKDA